MINYKDLKQRTEEWQLFRYGKIGGTTSKGLFVDSDTLLKSLLADKLEEFEPTEGFTNLSMEEGNDKEPFAREYLSSFVGIEFNESGWLQSEECDLLGISPDGISECETISCEIKCLQKKAHTNILVANEIPSEYIPQCLHYFTVNPKLKEHYFIAYRPESVKHFTYKLTRDSIIDLGWKKTIEVPQFSKIDGSPIKPKLVKENDLRTIDEWTKISIERAKELEVKLNELYNKVIF